jgi:DNA-binding MarR family transcriptional regulator
MATSRLRQEVKKKQPFDSPEAEAILNILRTSDRLQNWVGRLFRKFGLTGSQYNVLRILRGEGKPMPCLEIGSRMIQVVPAMTGLIDRLEKQGLVRRERCTEDRRVIYVAITERARKLLADIDAPLREIHRQMIGHLTRAELADLIRLLEKARDHGARIGRAKNGVELIPREQRTP